MNVLSYAVLFVILGKNVECGINVSDPSFKELPPIFQIDDNGRCREHGKLYCKMSITVQAANPDNKSSHWKIIQHTINHSKFYNHNELFHAVCVNDLCPMKVMEVLHEGNLRSMLSECYRLKYGHLGFKFNITELNCRNQKYQYTPGTIDVIVLLCSLLYFTIIISATYKDYMKKPENYKEKCLTNSGNPLITSFSILANWEKLCSLNDKPEFQKLKFIQGIRFYNMLLVIFCHTVSSYIGGYISNTEYFELVYKNQIRLSLVTLFVFLVQTFFLISAFLLAYHVSQTMNTYKDSKLKYMALTFLNRYLRILPPLLVMILLSCTIWIVGMFEGPIADIYSDKEYQRCLKNWWTNLIFINNHYNETEMCYFLTWYLAADTQLYLISLVILLIIWKCRQSSKIVLALAISIGILVPTVMTYKYGLDIIYRITPENSKNDNFRSFKFNAIYTSTFTNMASYMVGLGLGCCYYSLEKKNWYIKYRHWIILFSSLPIMVVFVSSKDYSRSLSILLSGLIKPCYALGIGAVILALSQERYGVIKKICELRPIIFLGNFTYSTYVVQYGIVFYRTATARKPLFVSDYILVTSFARDAVLSILCGFLMHILVEMPAIQLQKIYIPQLRPTISSKYCEKSKQCDK